MCADRFGHGHELLEEGPVEAGVGVSEEGAGAHQVLGAGRDPPGGQEPGHHPS